MIDVTMFKTDTRVNKRGNRTIISDNMRPCRTVYAAARGAGGVSN